MEKLERAFLQDLRELDNERRESIRQIYKSCYNQMLQVLDRRQRKAYKELYGAPLAFTELESHDNWELLAQVANPNG